MSGDDYYNVEKIIGKKIVNGKALYKIKWEGYPMSQCTWEPLKNLKKVMDMVDEYNELNDNKDEEQSEEKKNKKSVLNKKRKKSNSSSKDEDEKNNNEDKTEDNTKNFEPNHKNKYFIDESYKKIWTIRKESGILTAIVERENEKGTTEKVFVKCSELRTLNPWILIEFYESKIKLS